MSNILYIVMPAYNEETNIAAVVENWYPKILNTGVSEGARFVIADSGSTDRTHEILENLQKKYPNIEILSQTEKGHGEKLMALYAYAVNEGADYIFQTDSDGQTNADEFDDFWQLRDQYDAILGFRPERGDGMVRAMIEKILCMILRHYFGIRVPDANAPFRLMKASLVRKYLSKLPDNYNLPNVMLTVYFVYFHEDIKFHKISFLPRQHGKNSINLYKIIRIGRQAILDFKKLRPEIGE